jgi:hypothetical protein
MENHSRSVSAGPPGIVGARYVRSIAGGKGRRRRWVRVAIVTRLWQSKRRGHMSASTCAPQMPPYRRRNPRATAKCGLSPNRMIISHMSLHCFINHWTESLAVHLKPAVCHSHGPSEHPILQVTVVMISFSQWLTLRATAQLGTGAIPFRSCRSAQSNRSGSVRVSRLGVRTAYSSGLTCQVTCSRSGDRLRCRVPISTSTDRKFCGESPVRATVET